VFFAKAAVLTTPALTAAALAVAGAALAGRLILPGHGFLDQVGPLPAGLDAGATIGVHNLPLTPWQGLGVVALWTADTLFFGHSS
jgi:ABC-2 type transport system permease protein